MIRQDRMPFVEALEAYRKEKMIPFHTPGHKIGKGAPSYMTSIMEQALPLDLGVMYALDDLFEPESYMKEAQELSAELYGAGSTFFSVNGTTACIQAMIMANVGPNDSILLPREVHRSVLGGLILSGSAPIYMESLYSEEEEISLGPTKETVYRAIAEHPNAKALFLIHPSYYGVAGDIEPMIRYGHEKGLVVLVDEAHGAHLRFSKELPKQALDCGADCVAQSTHKLLGSLTQTSMLHCHKAYQGVEKIQKAMSLVQSTSPNYLLLASLDAARHQMYATGEEQVAKAVERSRELRRRLRQIDGIRCFGKEIEAYPSVAALDETKVTIDFSSCGLSGKEAEWLLRKRHIEVELVHGNHVLALITIGDTKESVDALYDACVYVSTQKKGKKRVHQELPLPKPVTVCTPREAWLGPKISVPRHASLGRICAETITYYPPGIPIIGPGEQITEDVLAYIKEKEAQGYVPNGAMDSQLQTIVVMAQ